MEARTTKSLMVDYFKNAADDEEDDEEGELKLREEGGRKDRGMLCSSRRRVYYLWGLGGRPRLHQSARAAKNTKK